MREKIYEKARRNLLKLGYGEEVVAKIISTMQKDPQLIPYDNHGKIKFINPEDAFSMADNKEAVKKFLSEKQDKNHLIYMLLPSISLDFQYLHSFLVATDDCSQDDESTNVTPYGEDGHYAFAFTFNSSIYEYSEYGDIIVEMTKKGLVRVG